MQTFLPYEEPSIVNVLILTSFILFLACTGFVIDELLACGLVAQILLGVGWGIPGTNWINMDAQKTILELGYLGLLLMIFEGGLSTPFREMKNNLAFSLIIALSGILIPIGLSFALLGFSAVSPKAAFAAGAALCSTSLGTTFTILSTSNLRTTKVGVLLTNSAVFDDIAGLVMMKIVSNLGEGSFSAVSVIRPVFVSAGLIIIVAGVCWAVVLPCTKAFYSHRFKISNRFVRDLVLRSEFYFVTHTLLLIGLVTATTYAGASSLTAAYVTGAAISWWDHEILALKRHPDYHPEEAGDEYELELEDESPWPGILPRERKLKRRDHVRGGEMFSRFYLQPMNKLLKPFFFASIGFSIPIKQMFVGRLVYRGIIYSILMFVAKAICGNWLYAISYYYRLRGTSDDVTNDDVDVADIEVASGDASNGSEASRQKYDILSSSYAGLLLGLCMVPRGEIGFLVSSLAESSGVFGGKHNSGSSDAYIIVTWAIVLCTIVAPILIGILARKIKKEYKTYNVLGDWGGFEKEKT